MDDGDEVEAGTDPNDETSFFRILNIAQNGEGAISTDWRSVPGREYAVYGSENLVSWNLLEIVVADGDTGSYLDCDVNPASAKFYRVEILPLP